jgi:hypothetical protein
MQVQNDQPPAVEIHQALGKLNQFFQAQIFGPHDE